MLRFIKGGASQRVGHKKAFVIVFVIACHLAFSSVSKGEEQTSLLLCGGQKGCFSANACSFTPHGGVDRLLNAVVALRTDQPQLLYLQGGGAFFSHQLDVSFDGTTPQVQPIQDPGSEIASAEKMLTVLNTTQPDAYAVDIGDLKYGLDSIKALERGAGFPFVCSNLCLKSTGEMVFRGEAVLRVNSLKVLVLNFLSERRSLPKDLTLMSFPEMCRKFQTKWKGYDLVVLVTDLEKYDVEITKGLPFFKGLPHIVYRTKGLHVTNQASRYVEVTTEGYYTLNMVDVKNLCSPIAGVASPKQLEEACEAISSLYVRRRQYLSKSVLAKPEQEHRQKAIAWQTAQLDHAYRILALGQAANCFVDENAVVLKELDFGDQNILTDLAQDPFRLDARWLRAGKN